VPPFATGSRSVLEEVGDGEEVHAHGRRYLADGQGANKDHPVPDRIDLEAASTGIMIGMRRYEMEMASRIMPSPRSKRSTRRIMTTDSGDILMIPLGRRIDNPDHGRGPGKDSRKPPRMT